MRIQMLLKRMSVSDSGGCFLELSWPVEFLAVGSFVFLCFYLLVFVVFMILSYFANRDDQFGKIIVFVSFLFLHQVLMGNLLAMGIFRFLVTFLSIAYASLV